MEKLAPQLQRAGVCNGSQPYRNARAFRKAPLCREKLCSVSGRAVSQLEAHFSEASSIALLRRSQSCCLKSEAVDRVAELLSWWVRFLRSDSLAIAILRMASVN